MLTRYMFDFSRISKKVWVFSILALLCAVICAGGIWWLDEAVKGVQSSSLPVQPVKVLPDNYTPLGDDRKDVDVVILIDQSDSMYNSDPTNLRIHAAELMSASLASDIFPRATSIGVVNYAAVAEQLIPLTPVTEDTDRQAIIKNITQPLNKGDSWGQGTDIFDALKIADTMLFTDRPPNSKNTPAIILLTDGFPEAGPRDNNQAGITTLVDSLIDRGTIIFVVVTRNEDTVKKEKPEMKTWRDLWKQISDHNLNLQYVEAQAPDDLETIYNQTRSRLVHEGTKPGERTAYDPTAESSAIVMPPNLLQADLMINLPNGFNGGKGGLVLTAPDGTTFDQLSSIDPTNHLLQGRWYYRYKLNRPIPGNWTIKMEATQTIYYVLNTESLFSARIAWLGEGEPYIRKNGESQVPVVIVDEKGKPVNSDFRLTGEVIKIAKGDNDAYIEKSTPAAVSGGSDGPQGVRLYYLQLSADAASEDGFARVQVSGDTADGTQVNILQMRLPVIDVPDQAFIEAPEQVVCDHETLNFWPPQIICNTTIPVKVSISQSDKLVENSSTGMLYMDGAQPVSMDNQNDGYIGKTPALLSAGTYGYAVQIRGKAKSTLLNGGKSESEFYWEDWKTAEVQVLWPEWIPDLRQRLFVAVWLLTVAALWKPVIVTILLPILGLLRIAPHGYYSQSSENDSTDLYPIAQQRHKLFSLTLGFDPGCDIYVDEQTDIDLPMGKVNQWIFKWLKRRAYARLVMTIGGLHFEGDDFRQVPDATPQIFRLKGPGGTVRVCKKEFDQ